MLVFFHIVVSQQYWALTESRKLLKPVLRFLHFTLIFTSRLDAVFKRLQVLSTSEAFVFPCYLYVTATAVVPRGIVVLLGMLIPDRK